jgi:dienelactone hydrolase
MLHEIVKTCFFIGVFWGTTANAAVNILNIEEQGFVGKYYPASSTEKRVAVLVLGGSEGGFPDRLAKPIIDAGLPVLALAYFKAEGLPQELEKIPLEYIYKAKAWLQSQANVKLDELVVVGWSKGAELALLLATTDKTITQVVAIAPSSVVWAGILQDWTKVPASSWTLQGQELAYVAFKPSGPINGLIDLYTQSLENRADKGRATIPVEKIHGSVVLMSSDMDEIWPSSQMAQSICAKINISNNATCEHLNFSGVDHLLNYQFLDTSNPLFKTFMHKIIGD